MKKIAIYLLFLSLLIALHSCKQNKNKSTAVDFIIGHAQVLTMDKQKNIYSDAAVVVDKGRIIEIGKTDSILAHYTTTKFIDAKNKLVMPGLVNTHSHSAMTIFRGVSDDTQLHDWLYTCIFPLEAKFVTPRNVRLGTQLAIVEMLRSGTTIFNDMYYFEDEVAKAAKEIGIRAVVNEGLIGFPVPNAANSDEGIKYIEHLMKKWNGDSLIVVGVSVHAPYTCSSELVKKAWALSQKYKVPFNIHLAESQWEVDSIMKTFNCTPVAYLNSLGVLTDNMVAAHCVHLTKEDITLLANNHVGIAHNPECNMKLCSGVAPIPALLKENAEVGLGTDGAASNNNLDMFQAMYTAALLHKLSSNDPTVMNAQQVVEMATIGGAKVLGIDKLIGSLEKGKAADMLIIDLNRPEVYPNYNIYSTLVYSIQSSAVNSVIINGKMVMENRKIIHIDEDKLYKDISLLADSIKSFRKAHQK